MFQAYHYTDIFSFVSDSTLVMFDPHGKSLPNQMEGIRSDMGAEGWAQKFADQIEPFLISGLAACTEHSIAGTVYATFAPRYLFEPHFLFHAMG